MVWYIVNSNHKVFIYSTYNLFSLSFYTKSSLLLKNFTQRSLCQFKHCFGLCDNYHNKGFIIQKLKVKNMSSITLKLRTGLI